MRTTTLLLLPLAALLLSWQPDRPVNLRRSIPTETNRIYDKLVRLRRDLHAHPELAGKEVRTQQVIRQYLLDLGLDVKTGTYGHSVVGILQGKRPGRKIAWRADMDAIPANFADGETFASQVKGVQHGCGHDVHMAIALGMAEVLAKHRDQLKGTRYFIFQPEEETFAGARGLIERGLLAQLQPDEIYGLHVTELPVGQIVVKPREVFAYQRRIRVKLRNELSPAEVKTLGQQLQHNLSRIPGQAKPWEIQRLSDPAVGIMNPATIFRDYRFADQPFTSSVKNGELLLEAYLYETDSTKLAEIIPAVTRMVIDTHAGKLIHVSFTQENPTVFNNRGLSAQAASTLIKRFGKERVSTAYGQAPYFNDDFTYFQQEVPGVYFLLGGTNREKGLVAMNHAPGFRVDEECIRVGVECFSLLLVERLGG